MLYRLFQIQWLLAPLFFLAFNPLLKAQEYHAYGSGSFFEAIENPSVALFTDNCKKVAANFLIPSFSANGNLYGAGAPYLSPLILDNNESFLRNAGAVTPHRSRTGGMGFGRMHIMSAKVFVSRKYHQEVLLDYSLTAYGSFSAVNDLFRGLSPEYIRDNLLSGGQMLDWYKGAMQAGIYNQISVGYTRDLSDQVRAGIKLGYVSGLSYWQVNLYGSRTQIDPRASDYMTLSLRADATSLGEGSLGLGSFGLHGRNPGFSVTVATDVTLNENLRLNFAFKDLGYIWWKPNLKPEQENPSRFKSFELNNPIYDGQIDDLQINDILDSFVLSPIDDLRKTMRTTLPGRAEISATAASYLPFLRSTAFASIPLTTEGLDFALLNDLVYKNWHLILQTGYNSFGFFNLGLHLMLKSKSVDFIFGTQSLPSTTGIASHVLSTKANKAPYSGRISLGLNFGLAFKLGNCYWLETNCAYTNRKKQRKLNRRVRNDRHIPQDQG